jgi:hypothetical protein
MSEPDENKGNSDSRSDQNSAEQQASNPPHLESNPAKPAGEGPDNKAERNQKETLDAIKKGERIALIIAGIVAFVTICQFLLAWTNGKSTSNQIDRLITAAQTQATAAQQMVSASERNAGAAEKFATNAGYINNGVGDAVNKLAAQAEQLEVSRKSSEGNFRQDQRAWVGVTGFDPSLEPRHGTLVALGGGLSVDMSDRTPATTVRVLIANTGKSPARHVTATVGFFWAPNIYTPTDADGAWIERIISAKQLGRFKGVTQIAISPSKSSTLPYDPNLVPSPDIDASYLPSDVYIGALASGIPYRFSIPEQFTISRATLVIYGQIEYTNRPISDQTLYTKFCYLATDLSRSNSFSVCPIYNDME